ncbi:MAG: hypothetical protein KIT09_19090 [Bryobacteraceae bacterium]|nr:hypothetical protein [Bryobacteraceae bacterium]
MPLNARRLVRKMRGGAQAHLIEADDGNFYVVKFKNNPQHRRILVNELVAGVFLRYLQIATPETAIVNVTADFLDANPDVHIRLGSRTERVEPGWHFGSRYPDDPNRIAVYDFIPDTLLRKVVNLDDFLGILVFDKWIGNADARQSIFFRSNVRQWLPGREGQPSRLGFVAWMMDHGYVFNGPHWDFVDSPLAGLYFRPSVYERVRSWDDFQPWLGRVTHFPEEVVDEAWRQLPPQWLNGDEEALERLFEKLLRRRPRVSDLLRGAAAGKANPFPNWKHA